MMDKAWIYGAPNKIHYTEKSETKIVILTRPIVIAIRGG